jgi:hypothetical protein
MTMPRSLLLESAETGRFGLILGKFIQGASESGEGLPTKYLVIWPGQTKPTIETLSRQYVAGSISHAVVANSGDLSMWAAVNPRFAFMEILAEESLIATDGKSTSAMVSDSKIVRRWKDVIGTNRPSEDYDEIVKWLAFEKKISVLPGRTRMKLVVEPAGIFQHELNSLWWENDETKAIVKSFSKVVTLLTPRFYEWHNDLATVNLKNQGFREFIEFCKRTEFVLGEQSIEPNGESSSSKAFREYLDSLSGSESETAHSVLALVWGDLSHVKISSTEAIKYLETISSNEIRDFRVLSALIKSLVENAKASNMTPEQIVIISSLACNSNIAVNFRDQVETALESVPSDLWATLASTKRNEMSPILNFLGFQSPLGRKLLLTLVSEYEHLFASAVFWAALKNVVLNAENLSSLSRPLMSELIQPFVIQALSECLSDSSLSSISLALEDPLVSKKFDSETWSNWISNALKTRNLERGPLIHSALTNEDRLGELGTQVEALEKQVTLLGRENLVQAKDLEVAKSEVANLVVQAEQARMGMKASVNSQSEQQTRDLMRSLAKLLITAGSLPDKVDPSVYLQMVQQVKAIGIVPIGVVGEEVSFDPTRHIAPPGTEVSPADTVLVVAPGFENKLRDGGEVVWKAQVVTK